MKCSISNCAKIVGISAVVPPKKMCLLDDKNLYNGDKKRLNRVINSSGFLYRNVADKQVLASDLCYEAAVDLIESTNFKKELIDALIFISYTPDYLMPATSYVLHSRLGLSKNCIVMDIPQACSGYEIGLFQAAMLLQSGCKNVLLLVGDCFSKFSDMFINHKVPVFGDAGTATLIKYEKNAKPMFFNIHSDGKNYDSLICRNGGFRNSPKKNDFYENGEYKYKADMDGGRIFEFAMNEVSNGILELMRYAGIKDTNIDYFVLHQANKFILENIARQLQISEKKIPMETLTNYGNQCGASVPCTICDQLSEFLNNKTKMLLLSGFGVGLSWANAIITVNNAYFSKIIDYKGK